LSALGTPTYKTPNHAPKPRAEENILRGMSVKLTSQFA
jgi:hypothetical protein